VRISVQAELFDIAAEFARLQDAGAEAGAIASFLGVVRSTQAHPINAMVLEHYPAMTAKAISRIAVEAEIRFALLACTIIHRHGRLLPGEPIVFVGAAAPHRHAALDAVAFLMDWLKTRAPFWKQEIMADGRAIWVAAKAEDDAAVERWDAAGEVITSRSA
jgi:molybdopterin synthase catalytic subunit